jgi:hypothetical protein
MSCLQVFSTLDRFRVKSLVAASLRPQAIYHYAGLLGIQAVTFPHFLAAFVVRPTKRGFFPILLEATRGFTNRRNLRAYPTTASGSEKRIVANPVDFSQIKTKNPAMLGDMHCGAFL